MTRKPRKHVVVNVCMGCLLVELEELANLHRDRAEFASGIALAIEAIKAHGVVLGTADRAGPR